MAEKYYEPLGVPSTIRAMDQDIKTQLSAAKRANSIKDTMGYEILKQVLHEELKWRENVVRRLTQLTPLADDGSISTLTFMDTSDVITRAFLIPLSNKLKIAALDKPDAIQDNNRVKTALFRYHENKGLFEKLLYIRMGLETLLSGRSDLGVTKSHGAVWNTLVGNLRDLYSVMILTFEDESVEYVTNPHNRFFMQRHCPHLYLSVDQVQYNKARDILKLPKEHFEQSASVIFDNIAKELKSLRDFSNFIAFLRAIVQDVTNPTEERALFHWIDECTTKAEHIGHVMETTLARNKNPIMMDRDDESIDDAAMANFNDTCAKKT